MSVGYVSGPSPWWTHTHRHARLAEANGPPAILWAPICQIEHCTMSDTWVTQSEATCAKRWGQHVWCSITFPCCTCVDRSHYQNLHISPMAMRSEWVWPDVNPMRHATLNLWSNVFRHQNLNQFPHSGHHVEDRTSFEIWHPKLRK